MEVVGQREGKKCEHRWGDPGTPHRVSRGAWWGAGPPPWPSPYCSKGKLKVTELSAGDRKPPGRPDTGCLPWAP